jgi:rRNA-processing protein FCF1
LSLTVLLDSNFLILPVSQRIDVFNEIEKLLSTNVIFVTIRPVINELKRLSKKSTKLGKKALLALNFISKCKILEFDSENVLKGNTDDFIVEFSKGKEIIVATNDINLKKRLRELNIPVIYLRGHSQIKLDGYFE